MAPRHPAHISFERHPSWSNAYIASASFLLREAIQKNGCRWQDDGNNLADAMMVIFKKTGVPLHDPATRLFGVWCTDFSRNSALAPHQSAADDSEANGFHI